MGKFISKQGIQNFGEAFLSTVEQQRRLQQQQEQFDEQMGFRERQLDLTEVYRQGLFAQNQAQEDRLREGQKIDLIKGGFTPVQEGFSPDDMTKQGGGHYFPTLDVGGNLYKYPESEAPDKDWKQITIKENGKPIQYWEDTKTGERRLIGEKYYQPTGSGSGGGNQNPYVSSIDFDNAYRNYEGYRDVSRDTPLGGTDDKTFVVNGKEVTLTPEQIKTEKDRAYKKFLSHANNRADALDKTYKGFEAFYNDFKERKDLKGVMPQKIMDVISKDPYFSQFPPDAIREMFKILIKVNG